MGLIKESKQKVHIEKYDLKNGEMIDEFNTLSICARKNGIDKSNLKKCCDGKIKSLDGYGYRYKFLE